MTKRARRLMPEERAHDPEEAYADAFAMALLMPEPLVYREWRELSGSGGVCVVILAYRFGVPVEYMTRRLDDLGLPWRRQPETGGAGR